MTDERATITIEPRFCGPDDSGNGGYVCGLVADRLGGAPGGPAVAVTLRAPPPLSTALELAAGDGTATLRYGDTLVAEAARVELDVEPVEPVPAARAEAAEADYPGLHMHPFPRCFVCGPARGDGLGLRPGRLGDGSGRTACTWRPDGSLADAAGTVPPQLVWAALDCPGGWSAEIEGRPMVLGRLTARIAAVPGVGETCVVMGRLLGGEGRKTWTVSTAYGGDGRELGRAQATWIAIT